jgi:predicted MFS family arabinose efflux permease
VLTTWLPYGTIFYFAAGGMIAAGLVARRVADPVRKRAGRARTDVLGGLRTSLADPVLRALLAGTFLCGLLETQMFSTLSIYATTQLHLTKAEVGWLYTVNGVGVLLLQIPALSLIRWLGISTTLPWAALFDTVGFAMIGMASGFSGAAIAMLTLTSAEVVLDPSHQTAIAELADPAHRGRTYGVVGLAQTLGIAPAPFVGGLLFDTIGSCHLAMWGTIASIGLGQTLCFFAFIRRREAVWDTKTPAPRPSRPELDSA